MSELLLSLKYRSLVALAITLGICASTNSAGAQTPLPATEYLPNMATATSTRWAIANAYDQKAWTAWSSTASAQSPGEQAFAFSWAQGKQKVNYVKITPRRVNGKVVAFPELDKSGTVRVGWKDAAGGMTGFLDLPTVFQDHYLQGGSYTVRFSYPVYADTIEVRAVPQKDENGLYAVEIAEIRAGYSGDEPAGGTPLLGDAFWLGMAVVTGDFNGDTFGDIAVGAPFQQVGKENAAGAVHVYYGSAQGLSRAQVFTQDSPGMLDSAQYLDGFGAYLASGDFNGDNCSDLAIGAGTNQVQVLYGNRQARGLTTRGNQIIMQGSGGIIGLPERGDDFGTALAAADFNGDGKDDLIVGISGEDLVETPSAIDPGAVAVIFGGTNGLTGADQLWSQLGDIAGSPEINDRFGKSLAVGDFNKDGSADLAIGVPGEAVGSLTGAGAVNVIYGTAQGLAAANNQLWSQDWPVEFPDASAESEGFGEALVSGDFNGDGYSDLGIGVPYQDVNGINAAGAIHMLFGSAQRLTLTGTQFITKNPTDNDVVGYRMAKGNFNGDKRSVPGAAYPLDDLVIGVGGREVGNITPGVVYVMHGSSSGVNVNGQTWSLSSPNVPLEPANYDLFGFALASGDLDGKVSTGYLPTSELIIGAPFKSDPSFTGQGTFTVLPGLASSGLTGAGSRTIHFDSCDYSAEPYDCFDYDQDGAPIGLERLAGILQTGETDENGTQDADGDLIWDGVEIAGYDANSSTLIKRSEPKAKKSIYVVLPYTPGISGFDANKTRDNVQAYFSADTSKFEVKVFMAPVASAQVPGFHDSCINTLATENYPPASQLGWFTSDAAVNALFNAGTEAANVEKYAHVGRVCLNGDSSVVARGAIQYNGGWQFMVRMRPPGPNTDLTKWHRALASLIAHELGHSLGLKHGGDTLDDCSPLYPSVMNHGYDFQLDANTTLCGGVGFSKGVLAVADATKRLQLRAGDASTYGSWEYDILNGMYKNTASGLQPLAAVPASGSAVPPDLAFLSCWAKGDTGIRRPSLAQCGGTSTAPIWCGNWDGDDTAGTAEYCVDASGNYRIIPVEGCDPATETVQLLAADAPYDSVAIFQARTAQGTGTDIVSGCAPSDLGSTNENPYPLPTAPLKDHDDFSAIEMNLTKTLSRAAPMCTADACDRVSEPVSLGQVDAFATWW